MKINICTKDEAVESGILATAKIFPTKKNREIAEQFLTSLNDVPDNDIYGVIIPRSDRKGNHQRLSVTTPVSATEEDAIRALRKEHNIPSDVPVAFVHASNLESWEVTGESEKVVYETETIHESTTSFISMGFVSIPVPTTRTTYRSTPHVINSQDYDYIATRVRWTFFVGEEHETLFAYVDKRDN